MKILKRPFGVTQDGDRVFRWTIISDCGMEADVLDYGATIRAIRVPERTGALVDVVLGYDTMEGYTQNGSYYGATIGRFANRIGGARFTLHDTEYLLARNNGVNHLHGGARGFDKHMWTGREETDGVVFTRVSPDGEEGYPGTLTVSVKFSWKGRGFCLHYHAVCDQDTILNLTNHSYFNLNGRGTVQEQFLMIRAETYLQNDDGCLPTGEIASVAGTAMDFRAFKPMGRDADNDEPCVRSCRGYDANFILDSGCAPSAIAKSSESGIVMTLTTDQPGVQLFTANHMKRRLGKQGQEYGHRSAFCLETQHFPDCIHHPEWPSCVLRADEYFDSETVYAFSVEA